MKAKLRKPLNKVSWFFRVNSIFRNTHWPVRVLDILESKYHLRPEDMLRLGYIRKRMARGKLNQDFIYIFDSVEARERNVSVRKAKDLYNNSDLIIFRGNLFRDGTVHVRNIRSSGSEKGQIETAS